MASFPPAWEIMAPTLRSADFNVHGCLPCAQCLFISKCFLLKKSVNSLKKGTLANVPVLLSIWICCPVSLCLTTWSDVDRRNSQAPLKTLQLLTAVTPSSVILHGVSHHCLSLGQESAVSTECSATAIGRLIQLHLATSNSKTLALIATIKRRSINYREQLTL
jgi:hypothetical protein